jgi:hypothetical protein
MAKAIGPTFFDEIKAAGISGDGWACSVDGRFSFNALPQATQDAILAVYAAHNPAAIPAKQVRDADMDTAIAGDTVVAQLKAMTSAEFDTWWAANVTNAAQAIGVLKRLARVVIRKLL